jgi:thiol-disulfide isomerase/thioredoxin
MRKSKKTIIVQTTILTATLLLNMGCFGYLGTTQEVVTPKPITTPVVASVPITIPQPIRNVLTKELPVECTDDVNSPNSCHKNPINIQELQPKQVSNQGGEVHKLKSIQGQTITVIERKNGFTFPEYSNKVVILQMFGKNCSHCMKEMPIMRKIYGQYKGNLEIIAIQVEDKMSPREAKTLLQRHRIKYPIIPGENATNLQYNIQSTYGWTGVLPYTLVIKDGVTQLNYPGEVSYREINNDLKSLF